MGKPLRIHSLVNLFMARLVLEAATGSIWYPLSTKCCRIAMVIAFTFSSVGETGASSAIHSDSCFVVSKAPSALRTGELF